MKNQSNIINYIKDRKRLFIKIIILTIFFVGGILANHFYYKFKDKDFKGCDYSLDENYVDNKISYLLAEGKHADIIKFGNRFLKDDEFWYCNGYFWIQRAKAFYNTGNCIGALTSLSHLLIVQNLDRIDSKETEELYQSVFDSNVCTIKF